MTDRGLRWVKIAAPLAVLASALALTAYLITSRPPAERIAPEVLPPLIRTVAVMRADHRLTVKSQGTVEPRTRTLITAEVRGRVMDVSSSFVPGGFFDRGETLIRIDPGDYRQAVTRAEAEVARTRLALVREEAEAEVARREWQEIGEGDADPLTLRIPQVEEARALLAAAEASLEVAKRDLSRTEIRAPYRGRVLEQSVDIGQYVGVGTSLGSIDAIDVAEVRLPLPDADLAFLALPLDRADSGTDRAPHVTLTANFAGKNWSWEGKIVRTEGSIDPVTRLVHVIARVQDPYGDGVPGRPPLARGMFVDAEIRGRTLEKVVRLPRAALRGESRVFVVDEDDRLRFRDIELIRATRDEIIVGDGLGDGERICISPLEAVTDGMRVRLEGVSE